MVKKLSKNSTMQSVVEPNSHLYFVTYYTLDELGNEILANAHYQAVDEYLAESPFYLSKSILSAIIEELNNLHQMQVTIISIIPLGNW